MQRRDGGHQVDAGLTLVEQRAGDVEMQSVEATGGDPLDEVAGAVVQRRDGSQQPPVGGRAGPEHARRVGRATADVGGLTAGRRPRRGGRQHRVDRQRGERQCHEPAHERLPDLPVAQPQGTGHHVGQDEERHVDGADHHLPPRRGGHLQAFLQPHRGHCAEEHPPVDLGLPGPLGRRADQVGRSPAEVVDQQDHGERQPVPEDEDHPLPADAGGQQTGAHVEQDQFAVERQTRCGRA